MRTSDSLRGIPLVQVVCLAAMFDICHAGLSWILLLRESPFLSWLFFGQGSFSFALLTYQLKALLESSLEDGQVIITFGSWAIMIIWVGSRYYSFSGPRRL